MVWHSIESLHSGKGFQISEFHTDFLLRVGASFACATIGVFDVMLVD